VRLSAHTKSTRLQRKSCDVAERNPCRFDAFGCPAGRRRCRRRSPGGGFLIATAIVTDLADTKRAKLAPKWISFC
jgi:hypothetical protein